MQPALSTAMNTAPATEAAAAINLKPLRDALPELEVAARRAKDLQEAYGDLLAEVAKRSGLAGSVIRSFIAARIAEEEKARARKRARAEQLALLFEEIETR